MTLATLCLVFFPCPLPRDHICDQKKDLLQQFAVFVRSKKGSMYIFNISFSQDFDFKKNRFRR